MTEESMFWADGIGDGGPYSQDQLRLLYDALASAENANRGVLVAQGNELDPSSTGNNNIRLATGRAVVDGTLYENDAILDIVTASPVIGTTGRRCVLQKDWAARTVRAVIISSADGDAGIPALTQNDGTIWEIPIASFTITTGGVIGALADERELSGASQPTKIARMTGPQDFTATTVLADVTELLLHIAANEIWAFDALLWVDGPIANDIKIAFTFPSGTLAWSDLGLVVGAGAPDLTDLTIVERHTASDEPSNIGLQGLGTVIPVRVWGTIRNGATPGDLQLRAAQVVAGAQSFISIDSWLRGTRVE